MDMPAVERSHLNWYQGTGGLSVFNAFWSLFHNGDASISDLSLNSKAPVAQVTGTGSLKFYDRKNTFAFIYLSFLATGGADQAEISNIFERFTLFFKGKALTDRLTSEDFDARGMRRTALIDPL